MPDTVAAGSTFALDLTARDFFDIPAPYSGTLSLQLTFSASGGATPSGNFTVNAPPVHFDQGDFMPVLGTFHEQFLASGSPGSTIAFSFVEFSYTLVPDPGPQSLDFVCTPTSTSPVIAQTLITAGCEGATPTIVGTPGDDVIRGTSGNDVIVGDAGNDTIKGFSGADRICGGDGHDTIDAGSGRDRVSGGADDDVIVGSSGDDQLAGDAGNDVLSGNSGRDVLDGGTDVGAPGDSCDGGSGIDTAVGVRGRARDAVVRCHDERVDVTCVTIDCADPAAVASFWNEALGWGGVSVADDAGGAITGPPGGGMYLEFVRVPESKVVKNRVHLGCAVARIEDLDAEIERLVAIGAAIAWEEQFPEEIAARYRNVVLRDVEGNEFCLGAGSYA